MTKFIDHRFIPVAYLTGDSRLLLPDELGAATPEDHPVLEKPLHDWDAELKLFKLTGVRGNVLPEPGVLREALREAIRAHIYGQGEVTVICGAENVGYSVAAIVVRENKLREATEAYVNQVPIMTDANFDNEWRLHEADRIEKPWLFQIDHPQCLFPSGTILDQIGAAPSPTSGFRKVRHGTPMLSIDDVFEGEGENQYAELRAFVDRMEKRLGVRAWPMLVEPKVDGMALKLIYSNGLLKMAVTRGDGTFGDDVTDNVRISGIAPQSIAPDAPWNGTSAHPFNADHLEITGEVYMDLRDFARINAEREAEGLDLWKNPRNATSGAMKLHDPEELKTRPLAFVQHGGPYMGDAGVLHVGHAEVSNWTTLVYCIEMRRRGDHRYATDGAVVKLANPDARETVGFGTKSPNWACAFKFKPVEAQTTLEDVIVQVGRSGVLTPKAKLTPVDIDGTTVTHATLNNEAWIQEKYLRPGDAVRLQKAGAIIPEIVESVTERETLDRLYSEVIITDPTERRRLIDEKLRELRPPFSLVDHLGGKCPSCGSTDLQKREVAGEDGAKWYCMNSAGCPAQLSRRIEHFCSRGCLDIEGIGKEASIAIAARFPQGLTAFGLTQLLHLDLVFLESLTWTTASGSPMTFGLQRARKAAASFSAAKHLPLHRWIRAFSIPTIGENTSKEISRLYVNPKELAIIGDSNDSAHATTARLAAIGLIDAGADKMDEPLSQFAISGKLGPDSCRKLLEFVGSDTGREALFTLQAWGIKSDNYDPTPVASDAKPLFGKTFVITGTLSVPRDVLKAEIEAKGGKVSGSVTAKTDFLVAGEGGGKKSADAAKKGVPTIDEAALRAML